MVLIIIIGTICTNHTYTHTGASVYIHTQGQERSAYTHTGGKQARTHIHTGASARTHSQGQERTYTHRGQASAHTYTHRGKPTHTGARAERTYTHRGQASAHTHTHRGKPTHTGASTARSKLTSINCRSGKILEIQYPVCIVRGCYLTAVQLSYTCAPDEHYNLHCEICED